MPNWSEGTLRVRGKSEDLKRFIQGVFDDVEIDQDEVLIPKWSHMKNTFRGFCTDGDSIFLDDDTKVISFQYAQAWYVVAEELAKLCKKYHVDMRIYAFEKGMCFNQDIEIINGKITKDDKIKFNGADYDWECICPNIGG